MKKITLRRKTKIKLLLATGNPHKITEFQRILAPLGIEVLSPEQAGVICEAEETGTTFAENAHIKAMELYQKTGLPAIADDSGLVIDAMNGEPGVYSARFGGESLSYDERFTLIFERLSEVPFDRRTASFVCHICYVINNTTILDCQGVTQGYIGYEAKGKNGFGYDSIFYVDNQSMAEMSDLQKDKISHRGRALQEFVTLLQNRNDQKELV